MALIPDHDHNKKAHPRHEFWAQQNYSSLWTREPSNSDPERHKFWAQQNYSSLWTRELSNSDPERDEFWVTQNYSSLRTRESSKPNPDRHEFQEDALIDPSKNAHKIRKVFFFFRISQYSHLYLNALINPIQHQPTNNFGNT